MKQRLWILLALLLFSGGVALAQTVQFGSHKVVPDQNLKKLRTQPLRGGNIPTLQQLDPAFVEGTNYALLQFESIPTPKERELLEKSGVALLDYMGDNAYFVEMPSTVNLVKVAGANANALMPIAPEWKISESLLAETPEWTKGAYGKLKTTLHYFPVKQDFVKEELGKLGFHPTNFSDLVRSCDIELSTKEIKKLSELPWVEAITMVGAPQELFNSKSKVVSRSNILQLPNSLGGRGLTGEGVRFGIWDGSVDRHVDFGNRLTIKEFELTIRASGSHGVHVAGTVAGAGLLDPLGQGMAPKAKIWSYNFNRQKNGKSEGEEMLEAFKNYGISLTQNSYGPALDNLCKYFYQLVYDVTKADFAMDNLALTAPTLSLVYAAGNDQGACSGRYLYRSVVRRAKNIMLIGAVNENGRITDFSSCGPQDDGRLAPTFCAMGEDVYSSVSNNSYTFMSGTSMACPSASGTMVLLTERYHQLHNGADPRSILLRALLANTADDAGRWGPDYAYGYGIINGKRAVEMMEQNNYLFGKPIKEKDPAHVYPLQVPAGTRRLRVMITWNDTVSMKANRRWGEPALINDLDLVVKKGDEIFRPWVLNPNNPRQSAVTGVNRLDNIEQVLIEDPKPGFYNIEILPSRVVSSGQDYVLTWFIEDKDLELTYPIGGETFEPGDEIKVMWNKIYDTVDIDISYDGGVTYQLLAKEESRNNITTVTIPNEAPLTGKAKIRVRQRNYPDRISASPNNFTIMPVPKDFKLKSQSCSKEGWALSWKPVTEAKKYKVLKADVPNSQFNVLAEVTETSYPIQAKDITDESENIFSVIAVGPDGIESLRTPGQLANVTTSLPKMPTKGKVLLNETFVQVPSRHIQIDSANNTCGLDVYYKEEDWSDYELGSHALIITAKQDAVNEQWGDSEDTLPKSYDPVKNNNAVRMRICNVDLTGIERGQKVILAVEKRQRFRNSENHSVFKVKIGNNDLSYMDIGSGEGTIAFGAAKGDTPSYYDLSEYIGQTVNIDMYYAARKSWVDQLYVDRVKIYIPEEKSDLQLKKLYLPESSSTIAKESVSMLIVNEGFKTVNEARVKCSVNGEAKGIYTLAPLKPFERRVFAWPEQFDFSSNEKKGKSFEIKMELLHPDDIDTVNNKMTGVVLNFGNTYVHPFSPTYTGFLGTYPLDPLTVKRVEHTFTYTDNGGDGGDYPNHQSSTVHFLPSKPGNIVQITFYEYCSEYDDLLAVATKYKHTNLVIGDDEFYENIFRGDYNDPVTGKMKTPMTFTSKNPDGSIGVYFRSNNDGYVNTGWVAEVREIQPMNIYSLVDLSIDQNFHEDGKVPVNMTVENVTDREMKNVRVAYSLDDEVWEYETIPSIAPKTKVFYTFNTPAEIPVATRMTLRGVIVSDDYITSDNRKEIPVLNDRYCGDRSYVKGGDLILSIVGQDCSWKLNEEEGDHDDETVYLDHEYVLDSVFSMYRPDRQALLTLTTQKFSNPQAYSIHAWVDWNDDGDFDDDKESYIIPAKPDVTTYNLVLDIPTDAYYGLKRLRIASALTTENTPCGALPIAGNMVDLTIDLKGDKNPIQVDKKPTSIIVKSAAKLSNSEKVKVWITNCTPRLIEVGNVLLQVDNNLPILETSREFIKPFDSIEFTFKQRVDLSQVGAHKIKVSIEDKDDKNEENNTIEQTVYCVIPSEDDSYALDFHGDSYSGEVLHCGTFDGENLVKNGMTFEAWINPRHSSLNNIFYKKGALLVTLFDRQSQTIPPKTLIVLVNERRIFVSEANAVKLDQWQHLAVTYDSHKAKGEVSVYINGKPIKMKPQGSDTPLHMPNTPVIVAGAYEGRIDEVRIWNKTRNESEINEYMYKHATPDFNYKNGLIAEFQLNEGVGNRLAMNAAWEGKYAHVRTQRALDSVVPAWIKTTQLVSQVNSKSFSRPAEIKENNVSVWLRGSTDLAHVKMEVVPFWSKLDLTYNGAPVKEDTEFDFSAGSIELKPVPFELFGKKFDEAVKITATKDVGEPCDLLELSILQKDNPRMTADEVKNPVSQTEYLALPGLTNYTAVKLHCKASEGAKVYYRGKLFENGKTLVDLRKAVTLKVLAENQQQASYYVLRPLRNNEFVAPEMPTTLVFGESFTVNVAAPIELHTSNANIVAISGNKIMATGVGTATVAFVQANGNNSFEKKKEVTITVTPRDITVAPKNERALFGHPVLTYELEYSYPVGAGERIELDKMTREKVNYTILYGGAPWDKTIQLPVGEHMWSPSNTTSFTCGNYFVTPTTGSLTVRTTETQVVKFHVTDYANRNIADANVEINKLVNKTDAQGNYSITLNLVDTTAYKYTFSKEGYTSFAGEWLVDRAEPVVEIKLQKREITLQYSAGDHGTVQGGVNQHIPSGTTGEPVFAAPDLGYRFKEWENSHSTDNPRIDRGVTSNVTDKAIFEPAIPKMTYKALDGGFISDGTSHNLLSYELPQPDGTKAVKAMPKTGYYFVRWSDGVNKQERKDNAIFYDKTVEAIFTLARELPFVEDFNASEKTPEGWLNIDNTGNASWQITSNYVGRIGIVGDGNFAAINSQKVGPDKEVKVDLITPWISLERCEGDLTLSFDYKFEIIGLNVQPTEGFFVHYSTDGVSWKQIFRRYSDMIEGETANMVIKRNDLHDAKQIRLKFHYCDTWGFAAIFDNVKLVAKKYKKFSVMYFAEEGGEIEVEGGVTLPVTKNTGESGPVVTAKPNSGYRFVKWSDGKTDASRKDEQFTYARAIFAKTASSITHTVEYHATTGGYIYGLAFQKVQNGEATVLVDALPEFGYRFDRWEDYKTESTRNDENVTADCLHTAHFVPLTSYKVSFEKAAHGEFSITHNHGKKLEETAWCPEGDVLTLQAMPEEGYFTASVTVNGNTITPRGGKYRIEVTADIEIVVVFRPIEFTVTFVATNGGAILGATVQKVNAGQETSPVVATPDSGKEFLCWSNGATTPTMVIKSVTRNVTYKAFFSTPSWVQLTLVDGQTTSLEKTQKGLTLSYPDPVRTGYRFDGWKVDKELKKPFKTTGVILGDTTLYATWTPISYAITFDANGGTGTMQKIDATYGTPFALPANIFQKQGKTFAGWSREKNGEVDYNDGMQVQNITANSGEEVTFYAQWVDGTVATHTISYNTHDGSAVAPQKVLTGYKAIAPAEPVKVGASFLGWFADAAYTTPYNFDSPVSADLELHARWVASTYVVRFDAGYGWGDMEEQPMECGTYARLNKATFELSTYEFAGWATEPEGARVYRDEARVKDLATMDGAVVNLYALWNPIYHTVTFEMNGAEPMKPARIRDGRRLRFEKDPEREGMVFVGWFVDSTFTKPYNFAEPVEQDLLLYAAWRYNVAYFNLFITEAANGTLRVLDAEGSSLENGAELIPGSKITILAQPNDSYSVKRLMVNGKKIRTGTEIVVTSDIKIEVDFTNPIEVAAFVDASVAPNPFDKQIRILNTEDLGAAKYELFNANGQLMRSDILREAETTVETSDLSAGLYLLRLTNAQGGNKTFRLVKTR